MLSLRGSAADEAIQAFVTIAAKDAKNKFGEMLDTVQREPLTIKKHGRAVAVVMSTQEYQQMKLERLRAKLAVGEEQLDRGKGAEGEAFFAELLNET